MGIAYLVGYLQIQGLTFLITPLEIEDNRISLLYINENPFHDNSILCSQFAFPAFTYYTNYDQNYKHLKLGKAKSASYDENLIELALDQSRQHKEDIWILLGHLNEIEINTLLQKFDQIGTIKNSYRTNRSAAILFSTQ